MTGTSIDGLDVALVHVKGHGLDLIIKVENFRSFDFPTDLRDGLRRCAQQAPLTAGEFADLARRFGEFHARSLEAFVDNPEVIELVSVHGQTVYHDPPDSLQLINPHPIAHAMNCPIVFDLRAADIAAGGQGAPITPIIDAMLFADAARDIVIINLGGFANFTRLPHISRDDLVSQLDRIDAGDICVCNQLLDRAARRLLDRPFDWDGVEARQGRPDARAGAELINLLARQARSGRSLGTGDECFDWLDRWKDRLAPPDLLRTVCAAISQTLAERLTNTTDVYLAGGGARNGALIDEFEERKIFALPLRHPSGVDSTNREAVSMAVLGALCQDRVPITIPRITASNTAHAPIAGTWIHPPYDE